MNNKPLSALTLALLLPVTALLSSCSLIGLQAPSPCRSSASINLDLEDYVSSELSHNPMVRLGIIPIGVPANLTGSSDARPSLGQQLASDLHAQLTARNLVPITELTNWNDWPKQFEDFFSGNFLALQRAKLSGYDLIFVGHLEQNRLKEPTLWSKIIDVVNGVTVFSASTKVDLDEIQSSRSTPLSNIFSERGTVNQPSQVPTKELYETLVNCLVDQIESD